MPSSSLLPDDPSVLFTTAGMQQFKKYYTSPELAPAKNIASIQKCIRTSDIDEVGDESHLTFFEMLGNFSFGGYWKKEAIQWAATFLINELRIDHSRISITYYGGPVAGGRDIESKGIIENNSWLMEKLDEGGIEDNFWGPTGSEGPCGPTVEFYIDGIEVWNLVFNEYYYKGTREELLRDQVLEKLTPLKTKGIDTGMGLERLAMMVQKKKNIYETDLFPGHPTSRADRIIADHARAIEALVSEGLQPSNKDRGYVLRRLIRRVVTLEYVNKLSASRLGPIFEGEKQKFLKTLEAGLREFRRRWNTNIFSGLDAYYLHESFGFPFILTEDLIRDEKLDFNFDKLREEYNEAALAHKEKSRAGAEKKFGGHGLVLSTGELRAADEKELKKVTRLHTATHLLHQALRNVLGESVHQAGSDITVERTRFDFTFDRKLTASEIKNVEDIVNDVIGKDLPVQKVTKPRSEAEETGALFYFKEKYPDPVNIYFVGDSLETAFSKEFCGGPHVERTRDIGKFKIIKEEAVSAGVRRIRATVT